MPRIMSLSATIEANTQQQLGAPTVRVPSIPVAYEAPVMATLVEGDTLSHTAGAYSGWPIPTVTFTYEVDAVEQAASYVVSTGEVVEVIEVATNSEGSDTQTSASVTVVAAPAAPVASTAPVMSVLTAGDTLTYTPGTYTGNPTPTITAVFEVDDVEQPASYVTSTDEVVKVIETATNSEGNTSQTSASVTVLTDTPAQTAGIAWIGLDGQSNGGTLGNSVDALDVADTSDGAVFTGVQIYDNTNDGEPAAATLDLIDYAIVQTGDTVGSISGPYGERTVSADDSAPVGPTIGMTIDYREDDYAGTATGLQIFKMSSPGKRIAFFQPPGDVASYDAEDSVATKGYKYRSLGYREVRDSLVALAAPVYMQCLIWWQGEANVNAPRDETDLNHVQITGYPAEFEKIYSLYEDQLGTLPPLFIVRLLPVWDDAADARDVYTDALNDELESLCSRSIDINGVITDLSNGGHSNRIFVDHGILDKIPIESSDPHATAPQQKLIGQAIVTALKTLNGGDGYTDDYPLAEILPALTGLDSSVVSNIVTVTGYTSDPCTVYVGFVADGAAAPSVSQLVAGSGGGILAAGNVTNSDSTPGEDFTLDITAPEFSTDYEIYAVAVLSSGEESVIRTQGVSIGDVTRAYDSTLYTSNITYTDSDLTASNNTSGTIYARALPGSAGKHYFEVDVNGTSNPAFVGIGTTSTAQGGGSKGVNKSGWSAGNILSGDANQAMGTSVMVGDLVQVAFDATAGLLWIKKNNTGNWNNTVGADPAADPPTGGLDISGMGSSDLVPMTALGVDDSATLALTTASWTYTAPSGYSQIG